MCDNRFNQTFKDLVSVIVPAFGVEQYIGKCLDSIINQTYRNIEIIVVDDGSKDKTGQIASEYAKQDCRVVVYHKENGGLSDARNYGIKRARGKYITCIDSDDYVDSDYIEYLFCTLKKYNTRIAFCQHRVLYPSGYISDPELVGTELLPTDECIERIMYHDVLDTSAWGKLYDRSLFDTVDYPKGMLFEDIGTTYKLLMQCDGIAVGYESKYNYILRVNSIVTGAFNEKKLDLLVMTDQMACDVEKYYPKLSNAVLRRRVYARFSTLNQMLESDNYEEMKAIIAFIKMHRGKILADKKAPKRDKVAIILLAISFRLYKFVWKKRQCLLFSSQY